MKATLTRDSNGNKTITIKPANKTAFSIQTNGNLPQCHRLPARTTFDAHFYVEYWKEIKDWISLHGTDRQKNIMGRGA